MLTVNTHLQSTLNHIHYWGNSDHSPMQRMFLTRIASAACIPLETFILAIKTMEIGIHFGKEIFKISSRLISHILPLPQSNASIKYSSLSLELKYRGLKICQRIIGLASTVFIGCFFSPETNFKIHVKLGLVKKDPSLDFQNTFTKEQIELKKNEIEKTRSERMVDLQNPHSKTDFYQQEIRVINNQLAQLLFA